MSFPMQWMQQQPSLQRPVVPVPTGNSMQHFLPNLVGGMGSFLRFMPQTASSTRKSHANTDDTADRSSQCSKCATQKNCFVPGKNGFLLAKSNLIIQTTLSGQDGDIGKSFCLPNGVHMTGQRVINSRKLNNGIMDPEPS